MSSLKGTLILATYEMPRHLDLVVAALHRQSTRDFEVIIADDGSGPETASITEKFIKSAPFTVHRVWQEHHGFRKCRILNQALKKASGETLIFLDGDCVPHRDFVRDHLSQQSEGYYLAGRRVELGPVISQTLTRAKIEAGFFDRPGIELIQSVLAGDSEHFQRTLRVTWPPLRKLLKMNRIDDLKGCNYSVSRKVLLELNGFDEQYEGYGREDTDIEIRLQNYGLKIKSLKGLALQFHVWHPRREFTPANEDLLEDARKTRRTKSVRGLAESQT